MHGLCFAFVFIANKLDSFEKPFHNLGLRVWWKLSVIYHFFFHHFREQRKIFLCFPFYGNYGCAFKRIKYLSTIHAFSSYSSFLSKFFGKETNPTVLIKYVKEKLIRQMRNSTLGLDLNYELQYMGVKTDTK